MTEPSRISYRLVDLAGKVSARFHSLNGRNEEAA